MLPKLAILAMLALSISTTPTPAAAQTAAVPAPYLRVVTDDGAVLYQLPLQDDPDWVIAWNHSVTGILVRDFYHYDAARRQMLLTASHTPAFDAGLGHIPGRGRLESDGAHGYWIRDIDEVVPDNGYYLRVGSLRVDHRILHAGRSYSLSAVAAGQRVRIEIAFIANADEEQP